MGRSREAGRQGRLIAAAAAGALAALAGPAEAQSQASRSPLPAIDSVTVVPGARYDEGGWTRFWLGDGWRDEWTTPIRVPVLDIHRFAGGLEFERQGGGNQSITLHMIGADGVGYVFRSVDKHPGKALPHDLKDTPVGDVVQDVISALHPAGALVTGRLLDATPLLHVDPRLAVMPDDPALGEFRETFAGMLGTIEEKPQEGPDDTPGFAGSEKVKGWDNMLEDLEESSQYRLATDEFVLARLFDVFLNDPDRAEDQWDAVRFDDPDGDGYVYRPLPRDRDWALVNGGGLLISTIGRRIYPKLVGFDATLPKLRPITIQAWRVDRPLLAGVEWPVWERAARDLQSMLTDAAIADALRALPPEMQDRNAEIAAALRSRRDQLDEFAREYYLFLAEYPDIHATDENDRAEVMREPDGDVVVSISDAGGDEYFRRTFVKAETREVRIDLHGGDDHVVVRGADGFDAPFIRVEGGGGDDVLVDDSESRAGEARLGFYDDRGENDIRARGRTIVDTEPWEEPEADDFISTLAGQGYRDWGSSFGFSPTWEFGGGSGLVLGAGVRRTQYGWRRDPHAYSIALTGLYSIRHNSFGGQLEGDYRLPNSPVFFSLLGRVTSFEAFRYFGLGNETELETDDDRSLVSMLQGRVRVMAGADLGDVHAAVGPTLVISEPRVTDSPLLESEIVGGSAPIGAEDFGQFGARFEAAVDRNPGAEERSGWALDLAAEGYPVAWTMSGAQHDAEDFATAQAVVRGYLDLPVFGRHPKLALRLGARQAWGGWPVFEGAFIGGMETVRGYRFQRFRGDQAAWGNAELRLPLFEMTLISRGRVGAIGLYDAGRVWLDGESSDEWHTAHGGGVFYETLGRALSVLYAHGEEDRWYLQVGLPF
ncbi:MAG TPA: hypothetical protein VF039_01180 [Longimicrobiales bacterium]